ncbi:RagB/SusD family nutrient uptake outer membrane protein [Spirosoma terrae]|uniref:RagB/SusD family nutrient uptake outer membrane protein n=1 Tax=Spirosoma terrae TaxID=1968276 RepID=A0A6L9LCT6_9BACT|nr:RagB/SusD family nutrient uptake outer membrane protein [Spirosoma terrae]NDU96268.1 RagB/SusD family nutrient uptake outer membrane protein [Spirosoma terrae]
MKTIRNKFLLAALVGSLASCIDLEEKPQGVLAPEGLFKSTKDVQTAINGAYGLIASEPLYGRNFVTALMLRDDMADIGDRTTAAARQQTNDFNMDASNGLVASFWPRWYKVISTVNSAIKGAEDLKLAPEQANPTIAEARFVRAFSYFHLVQSFGAIPYIETFVSDPESVKTIGKSSEEEVYAKLIADLEFAKQWLPDQQPADVRTRPTKGSAATCLASVYLTRGDYQKAYTESKWVIDNKDKFAYRLESDFQDLFIATKADQIKETIFAVDFIGQKVGPESTNDDLMGAMTGIRGTDQNGWSVAVPTLKVYQTWDARDYRKRVSFEDSMRIGGVLRPYTAFPTAARPHIAKFARYPGNANSEGRYSDHNYFCFRYAEVLLTAAEALAEVNGAPNAEAIGYINQVRARARNWAGRQTTFPADVALGMTKDAFINLVLEERRLELAFEFKRWYDIKRRKLGDVVFKGANSLEPHTNFDASRDYLMPHLSTEMAINPNLTQNPGY